MGSTTFHRLADQELSDAALYYELESDGLGVAFLNEVERCLRSISKHPKAAPVLSHDIRRRILRGFPYALLYSVKPDGIRILAVMNLKRRPSYWVGRE
jgi:toxin ParE1/3/4